MKVFITGATGFIGSAVTKELIAHGHEVAGLARSEQSGQRLAELGASAAYGSLEDPDSLKRGATSAEAVIHCAFIHDFADFFACCDADEQAIIALGEALTGTDKPFIVTSGTPMSAGGKAVTENDETGADTPRRSEQAALPFAERGVDVRIARPSRFVCGEALSGGFIAALIGTAAEKRVSAYIGEGVNRIHAVNVLDLAALYRLALEKGAKGAKYHGVGEGAIAFRDVANAIGKRLNVPVKSIKPEQATEHFGFIGAIAAADNPASSEITQTELSWTPKAPSLIEMTCCG